MATRTENIVRLLKELQGSTPDIGASAVVSLDGLIMASALPSDVEEERVAAMSAALLSLGERTTEELRNGHFEQLFIKGDDGYVVLMNAGSEAVLTVLAGKNAKLGLLFLDMKRSAQKIGELI